jgi:putative transposase
MSFISRNIESGACLVGNYPETDFSDLKPISKKLFERGIVVESVRYTSAHLERAFAKSGAQIVGVFWDPSDLGAIRVLIDGYWHLVPSVLDWFDGVSSDLWTSLRAELGSATDAGAVEYQETSPTLNVGV